MGNANTDYLMIQITIPGTYAQKRHRTNGIRRYDPSAKDKKVIRQHLLPVKPSEPLGGKFGLSLCVYVQTPESWSQKKKKEVEGMYRDKRPDCDNYLKIILDAMNDYIYKDDSQVVYTEVAKYYSVNPSMNIHLYDISKANKDQKQENQG